MKRADKVAKRFVEMAEEMMKGGVNVLNYDLAGKQLMNAVRTAHFQSQHMRAQKEVPNVEFFDKDLTNKEI